MDIDTFCRPLNRALTISNAGLTGGSRIPQLIEPNYDGVVNLAPKTSQWLKVWGVGVGADNDAFNIRVLGWSSIGSGPNYGTLWIPSVLGEVTVTLCTTVGVIGGQVMETERFADTITVVIEPTITADVTRQGTMLVTSPANNLIAHFLLSLQGFQKIEFNFGQTTGTPTMNALYSFV